MNRTLLLLLLPLTWLGCGAVHDEGDIAREGPPVTGALSLELTPELRAAGAVQIAAYNGPWVFRNTREKRTLLHPGDLLQVSVTGVAGLERNYLEYINEEGYWIPDGVPPVKTQKRTQRDVEREFPARARIPATPGLQLRLFGPYSTDCYIIGGEIKQRGFYPWREGITLKEAITLAGGPRRDMLRGTIQVVRGDRIITFSLMEVTEGSAKPFLIKPRDAVSVTEKIDLKFDARSLGVPPPPPRER